MALRIATFERTTDERSPRALTRTDAAVIVLSSAELAECTCPDACDRDHDRD